MGISIDVDGVGIESHIQCIRRGRCRFVDRFLFWLCIMLEFDPSVCLCIVLVVGFIDHIPNFNLDDIVGVCVPFVNACIRNLYRCIHTSVLPRNIGHLNLRRRFVHLVEFFALESFDFLDGGVQ